MDVKVYQPAKAGEGYGNDTADTAQRRTHAARHRKKYAQMRAEDERNGFERNPRWKEPDAVGSNREEIRYILFPPRSQVLT
jgi:hypothetical protein